MTLNGANWSEDIHFQKQWCVLKLRPSSLAFFTAPASESQSKSLCYAS